MRAGPALATALAVAAGCSPLAERVFTQPDVRLIGVSAGGIGLRGGTVNVLVQVRNPNPYPVDLERLTYTLRTQDSTEIGRGATTTHLRVGARDSAQLSLPLAVSWTGLRAVGREGLGTGRVGYRVTGEYTVGTPIGAFTRGYDRGGRVVLGK